MLKRFGYASKDKAEVTAQAVGKLLDLAGADAATRAKIGDMIVAAKRGAPPPAAEDVARRLGLGLDLASTGDTFRQAWAAWLSGKKRLRRSARERLEQIGEHWLLPVLQDVPLERLNAAHVSEVFTRIERINAEIIARPADGPGYVRVEGDVRSKPRPVGIASQHGPAWRSTAGPPA